LDSTLTPHRGTAISEFTAVLEAAATTAPDPNLPGPDARVVGHFLFQIRRSVVAGD
jgi:hypothetical protein